LDFATATKHAQLVQNQAKMSEPCGLTLFAIKAAYIVESTDYMTEMTFLANASTIYAMYHENFVFGTS